MSKSSDILRKVLTVICLLLALISLWAGLRHLGESSLYALPCLTLTVASAVALFALEGTARRTTTIVFTLLAVCAVVSYATICIDDYLDGPAKWQQLKSAIHSGDGAIGFGIYAAAKTLVLLGSLGWIFLEWRKKAEAKRVIWLLCGLFLLNYMGSFVAALALVSFDVPDHVLLDAIKATHLRIYFAAPVTFSLLFLGFRAFKAPVNVSPPPILETMPDQEV